MKSISLLASLAAASVVCMAAAGCSSSSDNNSNTGGTGAGATGGSGNGTAGTGNGTAGSSSSSAGTGSGTGGTSSGTAGSSSSTAGTGSGTAGSGTGGTGTGATSCSTGVLFEGNPKYEDAADYDTNATPKAAGQGLLADPPIRNEAMAVIGTNIYYETETEIWSADLSQATPTLKRIAGMDGGGFINAGVACADTQFLVVRDMTATADGKLALVDAVGGAVIEITDPGTANCKSVYVAGTHTKTADPGNDYPLNSGDTDGPGASAQFGGDHDGKGMIQHLAADPSGNYYVFDNGTGKYRKIATDASRTVSTIGQGSADDNVLGMAFLNGKLYATGVDGTNDFFLEIDPTKYKAANPNASVTEVFRAPDHFQAAGAEGQAVPSTLIADGDAFILAAEEDVIWRMKPDGTIVDTLAGSGTFIDFTTDFDYTMPHKATDWELVNTGSNHFGGPWIAYANGNLFWTGGPGINKWTVKFSCP